jgi:hypothetical protein
VNIRIEHKGIGSIDRCTMLSFVVSPFASVALALVLLSGGQNRKVAATLNQRADPVLQAEKLVPADFYTRLSTKVGCYYYPCKQSPLRLVLVFCCPLTPSIIPSLPSRRQGTATISTVTKSTCETI